MSKTTAVVFMCSTTLVVAVLAAFIFFKFFFVYSEGVNEGDINYFQKEGFVFKTYEGKMIQTGVKSVKGAQGTIQSNEFKFSVESEKVAAQLNEMSNVGVRLYWKRYLGTLPWRGNSEYVVDSVYSMPRK
ncbi:MAG: hypothetical protein U0L62_03930 [Paludibacteraceae bacterium]|jgi:hypothetical protein|nr:hypothetical protein [Paludibacteraceae bacterium]